MIFNQNQIAELLEIVEYNQILFIAQQIGPEILTKQDIEILERHGVKLEQFKTMPLLSQAFKFGVLADALGDKRTSSLNYKDFKSYIKAGNFIPLTKSEEKALEIVKIRAYTDIKGFSSNLKKVVTQKIIERETTKGVEYKKTLKEITNSIAGELDDWSRDFGRISDYIMHSAYEEGKSAMIEERGGKEALVYKDVYPGACKHCVSAYLTEGIGSKPKLFKLNELKANGQNIGKKTQEWLPTLGPLHPWCRCTVNYLHYGYEWDEEKKEFLPSKSNKRTGKAKIKITVGNKNFEVVY